MYWSDWVASEYNTSGYVIYQDELNFQVTLIGQGHPVNSNYDNDDMIKKGYSYVTKSVGWYQPL